jgi:hypothetical protein
MKAESGEVSKRLNEGCWRREKGGFMEAEGGDWKDKLNGSIEAARERKEEASWRLKVKKRRRSRLHGGRREKGRKRLSGGCWRKERGGCMTDKGVKEEKRRRRRHGG